MQNAWACFSEGHKTKGKCLVDFGLQGIFEAEHRPDPLVHLQLQFAVGKMLGFQDNWRWCRKCEGLVFHGNLSDGLVQPVAGTTQAQAETIKYSSPRLKK
ncbi:MAG: hypothetical protein C4325_13725 [Blastocatellia bacterium]